MAHWPNFDRGNWEALCDECGCKFKASELRKRWDGLMVCERDWEPRQPQDFVRAKVDIQAVPWSRPEPSDTFVFVCSSTSAIPGYAIPGCMIPGSISLPYNAGGVPPSSFIEP